jgi:hypothetical protein
MFASPSGGDKTSPPEEKEEPRRLLTLKIPRGKHFDDAASAMTDNGDSRPSTADSESSSHTVESSYSFRPKRQKRFRDEPEESPTAVSQQPPKKRRNRTSGAAVFASKESLATPTTNNSEGYSMEGSVAAMPSTDPFVTENPANAGKKPQKIKVVRAATQNDSSRYGTPTTLMSFNSEDGDEPPKDYKSMTKSEKMSASMKSMYRLHPCCKQQTANIQLQVDGPMAIWPALLKSARLHWLLRRLPRLQPRHESVPSHRSLNPSVRRRIPWSSSANSSSSLIIRLSISISILTSSHNSTTIITTNSTLTCSTCSLSNLTTTSLCSPILHHPTTISSSNSNLRRHHRITRAKVASRASHRGFMRSSQTLGDLLDRHPRCEVYVLTRIAMMGQVSYGLHVV